MVEWSGSMISTLRALWDKGLSASQIGLRMGVTKNGIVGKSHRLGLPARPSPIYRDPNAPPRVPRARAITLPPLAFVLNEALMRLEPQQSAAMGRRPPKPPARPVKEPERAPEKAPEKAPEVVVPSLYTTCQWTTSDSKPWIFCTNEVDPAHRVYCAKHAKMSRSHVRMLDDAA